MTEPKVIHDDVSVPAVDYPAWRRVFRVVVFAAMVVWIVVSLLFILRGAL